MAPAKTSRPNTRSGGKRKPTHDINTRSNKASGSSNKTPNYDETIKKPSWNEGTRDAVFDKTPQKKDAKGDTLHECALGGGKCGANGGYHAKEDMEVDHKVPWENYVRANADVDNKEQMSDAFNDMNNLRASCQPCNGSKGNRTGQAARRALTRGESDSES